MADFIRRALSKEGIEVEAKSLATTSLPCIITIDEEMRRVRDTLALTSGEPLPGLNVKQTFVINMSSPLIKTLYKLKEPELAKEIVCELYELALLSQQLLSASELSSFTQRTSGLLEKLLSRLE